MDHDGPPLRTLYELEILLRTAEAPLKVSRIKDMLPRTVSRMALRDAIDHYRRLGFVSEGSKGVMWTLNTDQAFWEVARTWDSR